MYLVFPVNIFDFCFFWIDNIPDAYRNVNPLRSNSEESTANPVNPTPSEPLRPTLISTLTVTALVSAQSSSWNTHVTTGT